jgi:hypothetical protein
MRWVNSDSPFKQRKFWFPPCRYGDPFIRTTWCAWIAAIGARRYVGTRHGLNRDEYRKRWGLRSDHPLTAPAYSERRSTLAKGRGLGRRSAQAPLEVSPPAAPTLVDVDQGSQAKPARGRRPRASSTSADSGNEAVAEPKSAKRRRSRSRVASTQLGQTSSPTAES